MGATLNNIKGVILDAMGRYGNFTNSNMASKWIYLGCDGDSVFQGIWFRVIIQTKEQIASFLIGVYYVAYQTNLVILVLSKLSLIMHIEICYSPCMPFFSHNPKKVLEFVNLAKTLKTKGLKLLQNINTHWISMLSLLKCVLGKYKSLVVNIHIDAPKSKLA